MTWAPPTPPVRRRRLRPWLVGVLAVIAVLVIGAVLALKIADERLNPDIDAVALPDKTLPSPDASDPKLPEARVVFDSDRSGNFEIFAMGVDGRDVVQLTDDPAWDAFWARISPDRTRILFYRVPAGEHNKRGEYQETNLWVMRADGSDETLVLPRHAHGWHQQGHAEWAPDGRSLAMFAGKNTNPQIWVTTAEGRTPRRLTDDPGTNVDPAWSPDGSTLVYAGCPRRICLPSDQELYSVPATGGDRVRLTEDNVRDHDPYFSPDGRQIAFLSQTGQATDERPAGVWNIRLMDLQDRSIRMLTDDENINSKPAWSPDGETIWFHRLVYGRRDGFQIWTVDVATGRLREITSNARSLNEYPGT